MKNYLADRKQIVNFNGSYSEIKNIGSQSCHQGAIMSTLLYVIYVMDQPSIVHKQCNHEINYLENDNCENNLSINYVDDNMTEVTSDDWNNIEDATKIFIDNQNNYHNNNKLVFNHEKITLMINSTVKKSKQKD